MINKVINKRYQAKKKLVEGGMSVVYQGKDIITGKEVAIKFMKAETTSQRIEDVIRFQKETTTVAKLNHPGTVKVYAAGGEEGLSYLVMELLKGKSLADLRAAGKKYSEAEAVEIIIQLGEALKYVHNAGVIHRDMKPGNIMVEENGGLRVKILDFGLALVMELAEIKTKEAVIGTFSYMSPEQTGVIRKPVDERSDLYSLGIIFYELLTGELPFKGKDVGSILHQQVAKSPMPLRKLKPDIPEILEEVVLKLLRKDAEERYQTAYGLIADLVKYQKGKRQILIGGEDRLRKLNYRTRLIGREAELSRLQEMFDQAKAGKGKVCLIAGEAGRGKSRLVNELRSYVYQKGGIFISGKSFEQENKVPYYPFTEAINEYLQEIEKSGEQEKHKKRIREAAGELGEVILRISPLMQEILGEVPKLVELQPEREIQRFLHTAADFIMNISLPKTPLVMHIDDLQWSDEGSLSLLKEIAADIGKHPLLIIGTYRDNEVNKEHSLLKLQTEAQERSYSLEEIKLDLFDEKRVSQMTAGLLGEEKEATHGLAKYIFNKSRGNPLFINEVMRQLVDEKVLYPGEEHWEVDKEKFGKIIVSPNIVEIILRRIELLSKEEIEVLSYGAVIGREFSLDFLFELSEQPEDIVVAIVDKAIQAQLMEWKAGERGRVLFVHERIKEAFYGKIGKQKKKELHLKVGRIMEAAYKERLEEVYFDLARHYSAGKDKDKSLLYSLKAGEKAKQAFANEEAASYFRTAISLLEEKERKGGSDWIAAKKGLGEVYLTSGNYDEAIEIFRELAPFKENVVDQALLQKDICTAYWQMGKYANCEEQGVKGLNLLGDNIPRSKAGTLISIVIQLVVHISYSFSPKLFVHKKSRPVNSRYPAIIWLYHPLAQMYVITDVLKLLLATVKILNISESKIGKSRELGVSIGGFGCVCMALPLFKMAIKYHLKALGIRKELGDFWGEAQSHQWLGFCYLWKGEYRKSIQHFEESLDKFSKVGDMWEKGMTLNGLGQDYLYSGYFEKAAEYFRSYQELCVKIKNDFGIVGPQQFLSCIHLKRGEIAEARERVKAVLKLSEAKGIWFIHCVAMLRMGEINIEEENYEKSIEWLAKGIKLHEENRFVKDYLVLLYSLLAESYIGKYLQDKAKGVAGAREEKAALKNIKKLCRTAARKNRPWKNNRAAALQANAKYHALAGNKKKAKSYFQQSIEHTSELGQRFELGKSCYEYGKWLKATGESQTAKENLEEAHKLFKEMGAKLYVSRTARLLGYEEKEESAEAQETTQARLRQKRELGSVVKAGHIISSILILDELLDKIMDCAIEVMGAERGFLMLYKGIVEGEEIKAARSRGLEIKVGRNIEPEEWQAEGFAASRSIIKKVEEEEKEIVITDAQAEEELKQQVSVVKQQLRSIICLPIRIKGEMIGLIYLDNRLVGGLFTEEDLMLMDSFAVQAGISIENAILYKKQREQERLKKEMEIAERIQTAIVPPAPQHEELEITALMRPAEEVGGDYYDIIFDKSNNVWFAIGDVTGHGVTAGLIMMMAQSSFSSNVCDHEDMTPREAIIKVNRLLCENVQNRLKEDYFMTMEFLKYLGSGKFTFAGAGHPDIIIYTNKTKKCKRLNVKGVFLALMPDISHITKETKFTLTKDDIILLYTDGIIEAAHKDDRTKFFGMDKLQEIIIANADKDIEVIRDNILKQTLDWCGNKAADDITMILIRRK